MKMIERKIANALGEQKTGHWEDYGYNLSDSFIYEGVRCSVCKKQALRINRNDSWISRDRFHLTNYCPYCGAMMVEPQESEESDANSN